MDDSEAAPWRCPDCGGPLRTDPERWQCLDCETSYVALRGVPDLRVREDVFLSNGEDLRIARLLDRDFDRLDFKGLLERYFECAPPLPDDLKRRQIAHILTAPGRVARWQAGLAANQDGPWLDLGCGSGSFIAAAGPAAGRLFGVDIALRWLLVARKRLDEAGLGHVALACACAEALPFAGGAFGAIVAGDVIEHVGDQALTLAEAHRVLRPGGRLFLASPNRYSLAPEPHVNLWGVGFLPRRWMPAYVRWARGLDFRDVRTMGLGEWRRLLQRSPFGGGRLIVPSLPLDDLAHFGPAKRAVATAYNCVVTTLPGQWLARRIGPLFHVTCEKAAAEPARSASLATPLPTRPPATPG